MMTQKIYKKFKLVINSLVGNIIILYYRFWGYKHLKHLKRGYNPELIVSLTSYNRRVKHTVYYTILSLFKQSIPPNRIILWLDNSWSPNNIPPNLIRLMHLGLEIKYCENIGSYKKLIPTLRVAPNDIIITVDDDVFYSSNFIKKLYNSYLMAPNLIHCTQALRISVENHLNFKPYNTWNKFDTIGPSKHIFPIGEGGVLYPPNSLYHDIINIELFMNLCPNADDIWFWMMAKLNSREHRLVTDKKMYYSFDAIYQYFHKGTALTHSNKKQNKNDIQLNNVLKYYSDIIK